MTIQEVFEKTDWPMLRKRKAYIAELADSPVPGAQTDLLEGLLSFLDNVQDAAELMGHRVFRVFLCSECGEELSEPGEDAPRDGAGNLKPRVCEGCAAMAALMGNTAALTARDEAAAR